MVAFGRKLGVPAAGLVLASQQSMVFAQASTQWSIVYAPAIATGIPTLSEWGLLILALVVGVAAVLALRKKVASKTLASVALVCALALGVVMGERVIGSASADLLAAMTNPAGGTIPAFIYDGTSLGIPNSSGVDQRVLNITPTVPVATTSPTCVANLVVATGNSCYIATTTPPTACTLDSNCSGATPYCFSGFCTAKLPTGSLCTSGSECQSGSCVTSSCTAPG